MNFKQVFLLIVLFTFVSGASGVDYYVNNYGEEAILKILNNQLVIGINNNKLTKKINLDKVPIPNFTDLDLTKYTQKVLYTYSSRGCNYNCTFCDVNNIWNGFNLKDPKLVINEMKFLYNKFKINYFHLFLC